MKTALEELRGYRDRHYELAEYASGSKSGAGYTMDFLTVAVLNRSLALIRSFCDLIEARNFITAVPLIRLQLDSCLRLSAALLATNPNIVADEVLGGRAIRDLRGSDGKPMTDSYLLVRMAERFPWILNVYDNTHGYIHLSDRHIF